MKTHLSPDYPGTIINPEIGETKPPGGEGESKTFQISKEGKYNILCKHFKSFLIPITEPFHSFLILNKQLISFSSKNKLIRLIMLSRAYHIIIDITSINKIIKH